MRSGEEGLGGGEMNGVPKISGRVALLQKNQNKNKSRVLAAWQT